MATGPAFVSGDLIFPLWRKRGVIGRPDPATGAIPEVDLHPLDTGRVVSRRHAEVVGGPDGVTVCDLGAANGVYVNGRRLSPGIRETLTDRDALSFGGVALTYLASAPWPAGVTAEWAETFVAADVADDSMQTMVASNTLGGQLVQSIARDELFLQYQPKVRLADGALVGVECLLRWNHPTQGVVYPDNFIPAAERSGYIRAITKWVFDAALTQCRAWADAGTPLTVSVNVSARDLDDAELPTNVGAVLQHHGVPPELLIVEVTESCVMSELDSALNVLHALKGVGVSLSIDDFGIGHSSLSYLKRLPATELKIDKSFVMNLDGSDLVIVRSAVDMGHELGMKVTAEGVETADAVTRLRAMGCDLGQGYLFGRPMDAGAIATLNIPRTWEATPGA